MELVVMVLILELVDCMLPISCQNIARGRSKTLIDLLVLSVYARRTHASSTI